MVKKKTLSYFIFAFLFNNNFGHFFHDVCILTFLQPFNTKHTGRACSQCLMPLIARELLIQNNLGPSYSRAHLICLAACSAFRHAH